MIRKIIKIDREKCNGCGLCAEACHEGAIAMIDGKAALIRDDYCDGLGDCLPACPVEAISFEEREAAAYDAQAVKQHMKHKKESGGGCPGTQTRRMEARGHAAERTAPSESRLGQWPVQIKLAPVNAPYFHEADLLIAADCTAYAYGNFHDEFIKDKITLIGCPKLDSTDYSEKLLAILTENDVKSVTVTRMEVPCCGGIEYAVKKAVQESGKDIPVKIATISIKGELL